MNSPAIILLPFVLAASLLAGPPALEEGRSRFCVLDIFVDSSSTPLAAYQIEFAVTNIPARIVGIEGGEHPAFASPPVYDPAAIQHERVIIAAFSTHPASDLPSGKTRVATLHLEVNGEADPEGVLIVQAAGDPQGNRIQASATYQQRSQ